MMSSNVISRFLPSLTGNPSIYQTIEQHERAADGPDFEDHAGGAIDEENLGERFQDQDLDQLLAEAAESQVTTESTGFPASNLPHVSPTRRPATSRGRSRPRWMRGNRKGTAEYEDDVPESLLLEEEGEIEHGGARERLLPGSAEQALPPPVPGPSARGTRLQWDTSNSPLRLQERIARHQHSDTLQTGSRLLLATRAEKAMYMWTNVENLDNFLRKVYDYYLGKGIQSIMLSRTLELLTSAFMGVFLAFLTICIDYTQISQSKALSQVTIPQCTKKMSTTANIVVWLAVVYWVFKLFEYVLDYRRLRNLHDFYLHLLDVREDEMQTISWQTIVGRLMNLRDANPRTAVDVSSRVRRFVGQQSKKRIDKQRMDAHDIANRLMRRENYLIAIFNKEILDTTIDVPFLGPRQLFSETIEWNINFCVMDFVFNEQGQVKQLFLKDTYRQQLIDTLKARFLFAGFMNVLSIPVLVPYLLSFFFLRFFLEFQKNPSKLGTRAYTRLAEWKFREFNELWHLFERRRDMSYPFASRYIDQFPKDKTVQLARFVAFIAGALGGVLAIASILDNELFLGFEITTDRTVIFYLTILGTIWGVCRGLVPDENLVFDPEFAIQNVIDYTHHSPAHWEGRLHSDDVRREFAALYQPKITTFVQEILSIIVTPFILWFKLPRCSERLVDFFREFTVHVDGLGYVCSFAVFEFQKGKPDAAVRRKSSSTRAQRGAGTAEDPREDYYSTKDGKMLASYYNFLDSYALNNPRWGGGAMYREPARPQFHPPPAFPGITQPQPGRDGPSAPSVPPQPVHRQRTATASNMHASPSPSLLLDPNHQPPPFHLRRSNRHMAASKLRQVEEDGASPAMQSPHRQAQHPQQMVSQSVLIAEDSNLGESWKTMRGQDEADEALTVRGPYEVGRDVATEQTDDEDNEQSADDAGAGQGVLGLLYQFQKAQTEGRGRAGVGL